MLPTPSTFTRRNVASRQLVVFLLALSVYAQGSAQLPPTATLRTIPDRFYYFDDELVTLDGTASHANYGRHIVHHNWYIDSVFFEDAPATTKMFVLNPGEQSRAVTLRLELVDDIGASTSIQKTCTILRRGDHSSRVDPPARTGSEELLKDDFNGTLCQWSTVMGGGFLIQDGELANWTDGDNLLVNSSNFVFTDGTIAADVENQVSSAAGAMLIVRYQDNDNFYLAGVGDQNYVAIFERLNGTYHQRSPLVSLDPPIGPLQWNHLQVTLEGATISVSWNGNVLTQWTDPTPWLKGKVGFRQCYRQNVRWDNFVVTAPSRRE